ALSPYLAQGSRVNHSHLTKSLCATGALLVALSPQLGFAGDVDLSHNVRAQSPGVAAAAPQTPEMNALPRMNPGQGSVPYTNLPAAPPQPIKGTRPASWPGPPLQTNQPSSTVPGGAISAPAAGASSPYPAATQASFNNITQQAPTATCM